jgi:hypothetical protein
MLKHFRRVVSRALMRTRVTLFGNNHSLLVNSRYRRYHKAAMGCYRPQTARSPDIEAAAEAFHRDGFLVLPSRLHQRAANALRDKVDELFDTDNAVLPIGGGLSRLIDGVERVPEVMDILHGQVTEIIETYYRSNYKVYNVSFYRTVPHDGEQESSFLWHFDNSPDQEIKLMIYLDEVSDKTGAFRFKNLETSERVRRMGFWHRTDYPVAQSILDDPSTTIIAEGGPGTVILFRQGRVAHKATAPQHSHRDVATMVVIPSLIPWRDHFARNKHLLSTNAGLCKNPWTDEPENVGYRY